MNVEHYLADYDSYLNFLVMEANDYEGVTIEESEEDIALGNVRADDRYAVKVTPKKMAVFDGYFRVNKETGEIIGEYVTSPYKAITRKEYEKEYKIVPSPVNARDEDDIKDYIKMHVDKRKLFMFKHIEERVADAWLRLHYKDGMNKLSILTKPQYRILNLLSEHISFHNVICMPRKHLAMLLGTQENHVGRMMKVVAPYVREIKEGVRKGSIKLIVSPDLMFKAEGRKLQTLREQAMKAWYLDSYKPWQNYTEQMQWLMKPQVGATANAEEFEFEGKKFSKDFLNWLDNWKTM